MSNKTYEIKANTPMGVGRFQVEAPSMVDARNQFVRTNTYSIVSIRMMFEDEIKEVRRVREQD